MAINDAPDAPEVMSAYLEMHRVTDAEQRIAFDLLQSLKTKYPGLTDAQGQVVLSILCAWWIEHREHMLDMGARQRLFDSIDAVRRQQGNILHIGERFTARVIDEVGRRLEEQRDRETHE